MTNPPRFIDCASMTAAGLSFGIHKLIIAAGNAKLIMAGINKLKKSPNGTTPFCHTKSVVISPNGLNEPPALEATTTLMHANVTNFRLSLPIAKMTEPISSAVVKLLQAEEMKNA